MKFLFALLGLCMVLSARAEEAPVYLLYGNRIYDDETIFKASGLDYDKPITLNEIRQKLETTGYFSSVRVTQVGNEITIKVQEKNPWFILPYFSSDSGRRVYGVAAGWLGIAGENTMFLGRYQKGSQSTAGSAVLKDDFFLDTFWITGLTLDYENALHDVYRERSVVRRMQNKATMFTHHLGYHLEPNLIVQFDTHFEKHLYEELSSHYTKGDHWSHRVFLEYGLLYVNEGITRGYKVKPYFEFTNPWSDFDFYQLGFFATRSMFLRGNFNWIMRPRAEYGNPLPRYQQFELGGHKLRGFPSQVFRAQSYAAVQNDVLLAVWDMKYVKLRPMVFVDWAYIERGGRTAAGAGLQVYFRQVAVPAIQIYGGYGFRPKGFSLSAAIGPQF
jgi:outer membrane protein assembly factor BamA